MDTALSDRWDRWASRWAPGATSDAVDAAKVTLESLYATPARPYHTLEHVADCLKLLDEYAELASRPEAVEFALWVHDAVYFASRSDNEARSAAVGRMILDGLGVTGEIQELVWGLVLATKHRDTPTTTDHALIMDIDMSILGTGPERYARYAADIRREYAFADGGAYAKGRTAFLAGQLARARLYHTDAFRHRFEDRARANLSGELAGLAG